MRIGSNGSAARGHLIGKSRWSVSTACRMLLAGAPFSIDGGAWMRIDRRIAGQDGLLSDLLVLAPAPGSSRPSERLGCVSVGDLETHINAGRVSCPVDVRAVKESDAAGPSLDRIERSGSIAPGKAWPTAPCVAPVRAPAATRASAPRCGRQREHFPAAIVAEVTAAHSANPNANTASIHATLLAGWPRGASQPPSRSTIARWIRRSHVRHVREGFAKHDDRQRGRGARPAHGRF